MNMHAIAWHYARRLGVALLAAMAVAPPVASAEPLKVRIGWSTMPEHMIPALYANKSILRHYGKSYVVEPISFRGSTPQIIALAAKEIDLAAFSPAALTLGVLNAGLDLKVVADMLQDGKPGHYSQTYYVKANSPIRTVADLKGKNVAINAVGSAVDTILRAMLKKQGMDPKRDVNVVEVSFANMLAMIEDDKVDASPIDQPMADELVRAGKYRPLFTGLDAMGPTQFVFLVGRTEFLEKNREALEDLFEDHVRAMRWYMDPANRAQALPIIARVSERPVETVQYVYTAIDYYRDPFLIPDIAGLQRAIDVGADLGILPKTIKVSPAYVDTSFVEEAKRRITLQP